MAGNRAVVYQGPGKVSVESVDYPELDLKPGPGVQARNEILKVVATNICGSDQHMVRGRTTAPEGLVFGHAITDEIVEVGRDVEYRKVVDLVAVPFNVACGRCRSCVRSSARGEVLYSACRAASVSQGLDQRVGYCVREMEISWR